MLTRLEMEAVILRLSSVQGKRRLRPIDIAGSVLAGEEGASS
jgi:hypothetical protein